MYKSHQKLINFSFLAEMPVIFSAHLSKAHRSGTSVNIVIKGQLTAAVTGAASGWQCQAALAARRLQPALISKV